ncbi:hypothetical protein C7C46_10030 [Streptomyces tateyamensis]|uniref:Uncharacterized protein n=1 Tax=Streptomyces tateyamensis TaxID=565073 RepID=A0A2V4NK19_9ACTN|nr:hypothetical protein [Streptomyces tateyamensis]PYC82684.1 hypothetical protein C7C46_10030 [Streptomyces tateyamensis]
MEYDDLSTRLADLADDCTPPIDPVAGALRHASRLRRRRAGIVTGVSVLVASVAVAGTVLAESRASAPAPSATRATTTEYLPWPSRGELGDDQAARAEAVRAWDEAGGGAHREVRVLYGTGKAGVDTGGSVPAVFLLEGMAKDGELRIAWVTTGDSGAGQSGGLTVRTDRPAPDPSATVDVGFVVRTSVGGTQQWTAFDLAAPGMTVVVPSILGAELLPGEKLGPEGVFVERTAGADGTEVFVKRDGATVSNHRIGS